MEINLWLDDDPKRTPPICGLNWTWVKNAEEAIEVLKTGNVVFASLDHDLAYEHYQAFLSGSVASAEFKEMTGYDVMCWMKEHNVWPQHGVRIHTMNPVGKIAMLDLVRTIYGRTFQYQYAGTHIV